MLDELQDFFVNTLLGSVSWLFTFLFSTLYDTVVSFGNKFLNFVYSIVDFTNLSTFFGSSFLYFILGLPVFIALVRLIVDVVTKLSSKVG